VNNRIQCTASAATAARHRAALGSISVLGDFRIWKVEGETAGVGRGLAAGRIWEGIV